MGWLATKALPPSGTRSYTRLADDSMLGVLRPNDG
jgi:hypothetical protein